MDKKNRILWGLSLFILFIVFVIWVVCALAGVEISDTAIRIMGVIDLCAIPVLIYTSLKQK